MQNNNNNKQKDQESERDRKKNSRKKLWNKRTKLETQNNLLGHTKKYNMSYIYIF